MRSLFAILLLAAAGGAGAGAGNAALAAKSDPLDDARKAFNNCLIDEHNTAIETNMPVSDFNKQAQEACPEAKQAYLDIIIKSEREYGSSQSEAAEYANEEAQMIVDYITRTYSLNAEGHGRMEHER